jgi:rhomboid family protein
VAACFLVDGFGVLQLLACALFLWLFGTSVEDAMSRPRFLAFCLLGGGVAIGLGRVVDADATATVVGAAGVVSAALGGYGRLYRRAHVLTLAPVPTAFLLFELPARALIAAWFALQGAFAVTSLGGPLADGGSATLLACAGGFVYGLLAIRLFAPRCKQQPPPRSAVPVSP